MYTFSFTSKRPFMVIMVAFTKNKTMTPCAKARDLHSKLRISMVTLQCDARFTLADDLASEL